MEKEIISLKATNGMIIVYEDRVVISRKTAFGFLTQGLKGDKIYFYKDLSSVEYRKPTFFANGYIKFITPGTIESNQKLGILGNTTLEAAEDPNTVILRAFRKEVPETADKIYDILMNKIKENKNIVTVSNNNSISTADEILKFKNLLDQGIITQEEFDKKKKELLG